MKNFIGVLLVALFFAPVFSAHAAINHLNGLNANDQFLVASGTDPNLSIRINSVSPGSHFFAPAWSGILGISRGGTGASSFNSGSIPFSDGTKLVENSNLFWDSVNNVLHGLRAIFTNLTTDNLTVNNSSGLGTVTSGIWNGSPVSSQYIASSSAWDAKGVVNSLSGISVPDISILGGQGITVATSTDTITISASSSMTSLPGGNNGQLQFNDNDSFGGAGGLTYVSSTQTLNANNLNLNVPLPPGSGGTGSSLSLQTGDMLIATDPSHLIRLPKGSEGQVLMVSSTAPGNVGGIAWVSLTPAPSPTSELYSTPLYSDPSLVSYYRFINSSTDDKGSNNGSDSGSPTYTSGMFLNALTLNGLSQFVVTGTNGGTWMNNTNGSITAWVRPAALVGANNLAMILGADQNSSGYSGGRLYAALVSDGGNYHLFYQQGNAGDYNSYTVQCTDTVSTGSWTHVAITFNGAVLRMYQNGIECSGYTGSGYVGTTWFAGGNNGDMTSRIGAQNYRGSGLNSFFPGQIDDLAVFSRALTATEVASLNGN